MPPGPFAVEVSLIDDGGAVVPATALLVSDVDGNIVGEISDTGETGLATVTVPSGGYVSVFHYDMPTDSRRAFTAKVVADVPKITFQLPLLPTGEPNDITVSGTCKGECDDLELALSCLPAITLRGGADYSHTATRNTIGCGTTGFNAVVTAYDIVGNVIGVAEGVGTLAGGLALMPEMDPVTAADRVRVRMVLEGLVELGSSVDRFVQIPNASNGGYGFSRQSDSDAASVVFSMVESMATRVNAIYALQMPEGRALTRQQVFDAPTSEVTATFNTESLMAPKTPTAPESVASFGFGEGAAGDAVELAFYQDSQNVYWTVVLPWEAEGEFPLLQVPNEVNKYTLTGVDSYQVLNVDVDEAAGYTELVSQPITDLTSALGSRSISIASSSL